MSSKRTHHVRVHPLPHWLDAARLLGHAAFRIEQLRAGWCVAEAELVAVDAADLAARLRGLGFGGERLLCDVTPALDRKHVRGARTIDARRRRDTTAGFARPGVQLDREARYSLTPEAIALELADAARGSTVIDAGCGAGGNTIGFARAGASVVAIERDAARLEMARHNARLYGVADRIRFMHGDAMELLPALSADVLFVDPPWGEQWSRVRCGVDDLPLLAQLLPLSERFPALWAKLPPSFDPSGIPGSHVRAVFGHAAGDARRVKLIWLTRSR